MIDTRRTPNPTPRINEEQLAALYDRAINALLAIIKAIDEGRGSGQARRLVHFLAGLHAGEDYPVDLGELRRLDPKLSEACVTYLAYDRLGHTTLEQHLPGGIEWLYRHLEDFDTERPAA